MSGQFRKMLLVDRSAYIPTHPAGLPNPAATHAPGRPPDTFVLDETMLNSHAGGSSKPVAFMRRVHIAPTNVIEATNSDDLEDFIAEMNRRFDAEVDALDSLAQAPCPINGPGSEERLESRSATSDSDESDDDVNLATPDCERSGKAKAKIYAPFLSFCQKDTPLDDSASTPKNTRVRRRTDVVKENCYPRQWMAVSSADRGPKISELSDHCNGSRSPPKYPDWAAEIAEVRERLAAGVLAETLDSQAPRPPMNFDSEVRISRRLRDSSVLLPKSNRRKVVHVSTHEAYLGRAVTKSV
ncbi:hypothetical protein K525DRAFT_207391 [Schizophyllum commune Loenen D]|nr:hypothetical protein K525DRAFT_207391 [Schizophyllum commune Loenen D]